MDTNNKRQREDFFDPYPLDHLNEEQYSMMNEPIYDLQETDIIGYTPENKRPILPEQTGDLSLIVLVMYVHGNNPKTTTPMIVYPNCTLIKASAAPKGCVCINYTNTNTLNDFNKYLIQIIQRNKQFINNDITNNKLVFQRIRDEYLQAYLKILEIIERHRTREIIKTTKRTNYTCIQEGKENELFELTYGNRLLNKTYLKTPKGTEIKIAYDSMYPSVITTTDLESRIPFKTLFSTSNDQMYTLQNIYDEFKSLGYKAIYIFDMSCDEGSSAYPEGWRGGKKNRKTYKKKKNKTMRRKNKKKYTKKK